MFTKLKEVAQCLLNRLFHKPDQHPAQDGDSQMSHPQYPRTLFVLKYRENSYGHPYGGVEKENGNWGDATDDRKPLSSGLFNSARLVCEMLERHGVPVKLVHVTDNNKIHREIHEFKADVVIIEAFWVVPEKFDELYRVCPNVKFVIRNHSEVPFLSNEGIAFDWMLRYVQKPNVWMSSNAPRMLNDSRFLIGLENPEWSRAHLEHKVPLLLNYYPTPVFLGEHEPEQGVINIGCFGAVRPLKNTMLQAIAALRFATRMNWKLKFHINGGRIEMGGSPILKNLYQMFSHFPQHELVNHAWMPHHEFRKLVSSMDLVMQVTFSETFNIVSADAVTSGVPTVVSSEIPWSDPLYQADPTSSYDMEETLQRVWELHQENPDSNPNLLGLDKYNRESEKVWLSFLASLA
jgi:hypothetical protein